VQFHRETNHPTIYNSSNALLNVRVELDMKLEKKNRYLDNFNRILLLPHRFEYQAERKILALCKTQETQDEAMRGGAVTVGGLDLIKRIQVRVWKNGGKRLKSTPFVIVIVYILFFRFPTDW
jgi:large subunit ribosomal protein L1